MKKLAVSMSIRRIQDMVVENLKDCVAKGKDFMPTAFLVKSRKVHMVVGMAFDCDEAKYKTFESLGMLMIKESCHDMVIAMDTMVRFPKTSEEAKYIAENWDTEQPSAYPEFMRQDVLFLYNVNIKSMDSYLMLPYRKKDGKVEFIDLPETKVVDRMEMGGAIRNAIMGGVLKAAILKKVKVDSDLMKKAVLAMTGDGMALDDCKKAVVSDIKKEYPNFIQKARR